MNYIHFLIIGTIVAIATIVESRSKRCYICRSRGPLGDCKDPFWWSSSNTSYAIEVIPCASGWCGKAIEGKHEDHLRATERICLQRPPSDGEERCSEILYEKKKTPVFMCFCRGDLCNSSKSAIPNLLHFVLGGLLPYLCTSRLVTLR